MHTHTVDPTRFQPAANRQDHFFDEGPDCRAKSTIVFLTMAQLAVQWQDDDHRLAPVAWHLSPGTPQYNISSSSHRGGVYPHHPGAYLTSSCAFQLPLHATSVTYCSMSRKDGRLPGKAGRPAWGFHENFRVGGCPSYNF